MPKGIKVLLAVIVPLLIIAGGLYGLAKMGALPLKSIAAKNPAVGSILRRAGLLKTEKRVAAADPAMGDLATQKKALDAQKAQLDKQSTDLALQQEAQMRATAAGAAPATPGNAVGVATAPPPNSLDKHSVARLATVYESMPADNAVRIFAKLPEWEVIAILRVMDEKKVADILALTTPERAARFTTALSQAAPAAAPPA